MKAALFTYHLQRLIEKMTGVIVNGSRNVFRIRRLLFGQQCFFWGFRLLVLAHSHQSFAAELPSDTSLQHFIEGSWARSDKYSKWSLAFATNGIYSEHDINVHSNAQKTFNYEGEWQIQTGTLITTITKTSVPELEPVGRTRRYKIIRLDATDLIYRSEDGQTVSLKRKEN